MSDVLVSGEGGVITLTLNRPERRNAVTTDLLRSLRDALREIRDDPDARVVVLTGAGSAFCGGADLAEFGPDAPANSPLGRVRLVSEVIAALRNLEQVTVAAVNGPAIGAGWGIALACDVCFTAPEAVFMLPEIRKGFRLPAAITHRLVDVVGPVRAAEIALAGASHGPAEGYAAGWVSRALPDVPGLLAHTEDFARDLAAGPRRSVATLKQVLRRGSPGELNPPNEYVWNEE